MCVPRLFWLGAPQTLSSLVLFSHGKVLCLFFADGKPCASVLFAAHGANGSAEADLMQANIVSNVLSNARLFAAGQSSEYELTLPDVGKIERFSLRLVNPQKKAKWALDSLAVLDDSGKMWMVDVHRDILSDLKAELSKPVDAALPVATYRLEIHTGDANARACGSAASVQLHGDSATSCHVSLMHARKSGAMGVQRFEFDRNSGLGMLPELGELRTVVLRMESDCWLDKVLVCREGAQRQVWTIPVGMSVKRSSDVELRAEGSRQLRRVQLELQTATLSGRPRIRAVFVRLSDVKGWNSGDIELRAIDASPATPGIEAFAPGSTAVFQADLPQHARLSRAWLRVDSSSRRHTCCRSKWLVATLAVTSDKGTLGSRALFPLHAELGGAANAATTADASVYSETGDHGFSRLLSGNDRSKRPSRTSASAGEEPEKQANFTFLQAETLAFS